MIARLFCFVSWLLAPVCAFAAQRPDVVPLIAPKLERSPTIVVEATRSRQEIEIPKGELIHVGVKTSPIVASGRFRAGFVGTIELGVRVPQSNYRFGIMIEPGIGGLYGGADYTRAESLWGELPILATYHERLGKARLRVVAGPTLVWLQGNSWVDRGELKFGFSDTTFSPGGSFGVGVAIDAGAGSFLIEARYRLFECVVSSEKILTHSGAVSLGYAFFLL